jgi:hypothetical protein
LETLVKGFFGRDLKTDGHVFFGQIDCPFVHAPLSYSLQIPLNAFGAQSGVLNDTMA